MPRIAFFFGISIYLYMDDHGVPHCHAMYGDYAGAFRLDNGELMAGQMPPAQSKKIKRFICDNQTELQEKWDELSG
jgi:hypothetical protein